MIEPHRKASLLAALAAGLLTSGCAVSPSQPDALSALTAPSAPASWNEPLPHSGQPAELARWWQGLGDPLLVELIGAAEQVSPTLASATSRLQQSRAALGLASAANPGSDASARKLEFLLITSNASVCISSGTDVSPSATSVA